MANVTLALGVTLFGMAGATAAEFDIEGRYEYVDPPQSTAFPGRVEVIDVFWYGCPHCWRFLPHLEAYEASMPDYVALKHLPAIFRPGWEAHAKAFYTAELLGVADRTHRPIFEAIHRDGRSLETREDLRAFFTAHGVAESQFDRTFDSVAVEALVLASLTLQRRYGVRGTPTVIVNGKYRVTGGLAGSHEEMVRVVAALVRRERGQRMATGPAPGRQRARP